MTRTPRPGLAVLGAGLAIAGIAAVLAPGVVADLPGTYLAVLAVAGLALLVGIGASADLPVGRTAAELPAVENRLTVPAPGEEFDDDLAGLPARRTRGSEPARRRLRDRLEAAAVAAQVREGLDRETARARLIDGSWTDDPRAAAFFRADPPSPRERADRYVRGEAPFAGRARAAARVVARRLRESEAATGADGPVLTGPGGRLGDERPDRSSGATAEGPPGRRPATDGDATGGDRP